MKNETTQPEGHPRKRDGYTFKKQQARRDRRREEAEDRNHDYSLLTVMEKLAKARKRRGESKNEIARLTLKLPKSAPKISPAASVPALIVGPVTPENRASGKAPRKARKPTATKAKA